MDLLKGNIKHIFFRYLAAAFGSAMISSIYGIVDMAVVGQYQGPEGTAALAVVAPIWNIIYSLGLLMGIGGSVLFSIANAQNDSDEKKQYFSASVIGGILLSLLFWFVLLFFEDKMLVLFGADESTMALAGEYLLPVRYVVPVFLFNQLLAAFLRNDNAPSLATAAVLAGGIFNIFGDIFCVFTLNMGIRGAGLATAIGASITTLCMLTHFFSKENTLHLIRPTQLFHRLKKITVLGFSTFIVDVAMGVLTMLFNRQIVKYLGTDALAVYGIIVNISTIVQCCAYSAGQAAQPIMSMNHGAAQTQRVIETLRYGIFMSLIFGIVWTLIICLFPNVIVRIFMTTTSSILSIAPSIMRTYGISFLLLPFNVFSTYYFQAVVQPKASFLISVLRGILISGILIYILPVLFGSKAVWFTMPITELLICILAAHHIRLSLPKKGPKMSLQAHHAK